MSIRSFVTVCSLVLMAWLSLAFLHRPVMHGRVDPAANAADAGSPETAEEVENLAVSVSP